MSKTNKNISQNEKQTNDKIALSIYIIIEKINNLVTDDELKKDLVKDLNMLQKNLDLKPIPKKTIETLKSLGYI